MYFNTNTRPETLRAGAKLMELGADFRLPIYELYKKRTPDQIRLWEYAFSQITYHFDGKVCGIVLSYDALKDL